MNRTFVSSSNLASVGYDPQRQVLEIEFRNGSVYQYFGVPQSIYSGLMAAASHGRYFDAFVKKGGYRYQRIR
ncbi:MAG: KTSC domain-containing protein [Caldilineales bacterium]|nr:KTSC domain-containing protein [Caldilineales bacterium]